MYYGSVFINNMFKIAKRMSMIEKSLTLFEKCEVKCTDYLEKEELFGNAN